MPNTNHSFFLKCHKIEIRLKMQTNRINWETLRSIDSATFTALSYNSKNSTVALETTALLTQQISSDSISVCVQTFDLESGIKQVLVSVGTTDGGHQIQTLRPFVSHLHDVIHGNFTHGMKIYVTNHAGLQAYLKAPPLTFDRTPPKIQQINTSVDYTTQNKMIILNSIWKVEDEESEVKYCDYCLG